MCGCVRKYFEHSFVAKKDTTKEHNMNEKQRKKNANEIITSGIKCCVQHILIYLNDIMCIYRVNQSFHFFFLYLLSVYCLALATLFWWFFLLHAFLRINFTPIQFIANFFRLHTFFCFSLTVRCFNVYCIHTRVCLLFYSLLLVHKYIDISNGRFKNQKRKKVF